MPAEGVSRWLQQADAWRRRVAAELAVLPDTLAQLREGADNFQRVTRRLVEATDSLERVAQVQAGLLAVVRDQVAAAPGSDRVAGALDDLNQAIAGLNRLNPLWPRAGTRDRPR